MLYVIEINLFISLQVQMHMDDRYTQKRNYFFINITVAYNINPLLYFHDLLLFQ